MRTIIQVLGAVVMTVGVTALAAAQQQGGGGLQGGGGGQGGQQGGGQGGGGLQGGTSGQGTSQPSQQFQLTTMEQAPHFALAWLGMGGDGHVASLFPNTDPRLDDERRIRRLTPDPLPPEAPFDRITLTLPALLDSDELLFVVRGAEKRALFEAASRGENDLPIARLLGAARQPVTCFT